MSFKFRLSEKYWCLESQKTVIYVNPLLLKSAVKITAITKVRDPHQLLFEPSHTQKSFSPLAVVRKNL